MLRRLFPVFPPPFFPALKCLVLAKKSPSGRHSNAARVSENIRSRRRAAIFAASISREMLYFRWDSIPFLSGMAISLLPAGKKPSSTGPSVLRQSGITRSYARESSPSSKAWALRRSRPTFHS